MKTHSIGFARRRVFTQPPRDGLSVLRSVLRLSAIDISDRRPERDCYLRMHAPALCENHQPARMRISGDVSFGLSACRQGARDAKRICVCSRDRWRCCWVASGVSDWRVRRGDRRRLRRLFGLFWDGSVDIVNHDRRPRHPVVMGTRTFVFCRDNFCPAVFLACDLTRQG